MGIYKRLDRSIAKTVPVLGSSVDPDKVALTIKSSIVLSAATIVAVFGWLGVTVEVEEINSFAELIPTTVNAVVILISSVTFVVGLVRKIANR